MDVLSQVLSSVRVTAAAFVTGEFTAPWAIASASTEAIAALLPGGSGPFVAYHLLTEGRAWVRIDGEDSVPLAAGDLMVVPRGDMHCCRVSRSRAAMSRRCSTARRRCPRRAQESRWWRAAAVVAP